MTTVGIVANGPVSLIPELKAYEHDVDIWIGADRGAFILLQQQLNIDYALGDFDSVSAEEKYHIGQQAKNLQLYPREKDETDLEIALLKAFEQQPTKILLFGVTGGRLDHTLINIQTLQLITQKNVTGVIIDKYNQLEMKLPGNHQIIADEKYPYISFIPITQEIKGLTLTNFYYPLTNATIQYGSTRCISNKLLSNNGTFSYREGILLLVKSREAETIPL